MRTNVCWYYEAAKIIEHTALLVGSTYCLTIVKSLDMDSPLPLFQTSHDCLPGRTWAWSRTADTERRTSADTDSAAAAARQRRLGPGRAGIALMIVLSIMDCAELTFS